ncbi:hypothetical protein BD769DRAFT_1384088 [Suillus cothurnatus]|nr:hypothetical protein BD769DRAFT_1384088 [Suillus cothurnatus]
MDTSVNKWYGVYIKHSLAYSDKLYSPESPAIGDKKAICKNGNVIVKSSNTHRLAGQSLMSLHMYPLLPPFRQTPGPIVVPQSYLQRLILERWEAEVKGCEHVKNAQLLEIVPGPALTIRQANLRRLIIEHWEVEVKHCEEAKWAQLLELVLAAHVWYAFALSNGVVLLWLGWYSFASGSTPLPRVIGSTPLPFMGGVVLLWLGWYSFGSDGTPLARMVLLWLGWYSFGSGGTPLP